MSRKKPRLSFLRRLVVTGVSAAVTFLIALAVLVAAGLWTINGSGPAAPQGEKTVVILRSGAGLREIAGALDTAGVIRSGPAFTLAAHVTGASRKLKAGEYEFPSHAPMGEVLRKIKAGEVVRHFVTIPEGVTSEMAVEILMAEPVLVGSVAAPPEGALLPETYEIQRGEDRAVVLERMRKARDKLLAELWAKRQQGLPLATPEDAVVLASIVEKETALASERPRIARVFTNRLQQGMKLQSDPTIIYDITRGYPLGRGIRASELAAATPHNTYAIPGLPPTPIANPGRAALAAVLDPPPGDELYFVADGTGGHRFSSSLEDHNAAVANWRQVERAAKAAAAEAPILVEDMPPPPLPKGK